VDGTGAAMALLIIVIGVALAFDVTNGFHDSANAVAALVATKAARPGAAIVLAATFNFLGPLLAGAAVANTIGGVVRVPSSQVIAVAGAALTAALAWNLATWWRGLPSSSSHALVAGLVGAAVLRQGGHAVRWGGIDHLRPVGVGGVLVSLAISPVLGFAAGYAGSRASRRATRRLHQGSQRSVKRGEWATAAALAFSHGANDAQKTMGVITLLLLAHGDLKTFSVPLWVKLAAATALTLGTAMGGWKIIRTVGSRIYRVRPLDGLVTQASSAGVILAAAALGGPVSTTHVVASSVVGVGASQHRRHVRWPIVTDIALAWLITLPCAALLGAVLLVPWRAVT
jgi:PiT family inorganic phosphate transporter